MRQVAVPGSDRSLPVVGQGTWSFGHSRDRREQEVSALRLGLSLGMTLIDTAEYYAYGGAEEVVGDAVADCRAGVFLVTKVWPSNAGYAGVLASVRASLRRLRTDRLDAVLLHWPTRSVPLAETLRAFAELCADGTIGRYGVSNFDVPWMRGAQRAADGLPAPAPMLNQVLYNLSRRGVENAILPYAQAHGQVVMAYSPLGHGGMRSWRGYPDLLAIAAGRSASPEQVALAFLTAREGVVAIPKAADPAHVRANAAAGDIVLRVDEARRLEAAFPRGAQEGLLHLPPYAPVFRFVLWIERLQHGPR